MRVLLVHDYYRTGAPSGEDIVFREERALLERFGVDVISYERCNDEIDERSLSGRVALAAGTAWSARSHREIEALARRTRPDIAHFHNTFPLISPSGYAACQRAGVPVVQTLHNFRMICAGGTLYRADKPCEDCVGTSLWPALRHRCYRGSRSATAAVVAMLAVNRRLGTYTDKVDRYVALTQFGARLFQRAGVPAAQLSVKPNCYSGPLGGAPWHERGNYALFAGRLSAEKGVDRLIEAWRHPESIPLKIAGDGPLRSRLEEQARQHAIDVEFLGFRSRNEVSELMSRARFVVVPSQWYETFGLVAIEALARATPVLASRLGALAELIADGETGLLFDAGSAADLAVKARLLSDAALGESLGAAGMREVASKYSAERSFATLMEIYDSVRERRRGRRVTG